MAFGTRAWVPFSAVLTATGPRGGMRTAAFRAKVAHGQGLLDIELRTCGVVPDRPGVKNDGVTRSDGEDRRCLRRCQSVLDRRRRGLDSVHSHYDVGLEFAAKICSRIGVQRPPLIMLT